MIFYKSDTYLFDLFVFHRGQHRWQCEDFIVQRSSYELCDEESEYLMGSIFHDLKGGKQASMYDNTFVIYIAEWDERSIDYGTLQHEIFHTVHDVMRSRGVIFSEESEEAFAYLTGTLTTMVYQEIFKR